MAPSSVLSLARDVPGTGSMVDWLAIGSACVMTAVIGLGFVLWEHREDERLARERLRRRVPLRHRASPGGRRRL